MEKRRRQPGLGCRPLHCRTQPKYTTALFTSKNWTNKIFIFFTFWGTVNSTKTCPSTFYHNFIFIKNIVRHKIHKIPINQILLVIGFHFEYLKFKINRNLQRNYEKIENLYKQKVLVRWPSLMNFSYCLAIYFMYSSVQEIKLFFVRASTVHLFYYL